MGKGTHLVVDCRNVPEQVCLNDGLMMEAMAQAARKAGAEVIGQFRYRFGHDSPPGFTAVVILDESHCTAHSYADSGLVAIDIFVCGKTDPNQMLRFLKNQIDLGEVTKVELPRFSQVEFGSSRTAGDDTTVVVQS